MEKRLDGIQNIKCLMMFAVVLYHSCMFFTGTWFDVAFPVFSADYLASFAQWLNTFHVATFTMASGYLFYYLKAEKGRYSTSVKADLRKRAKRLLLPYLAVSLTWAIPFYGLFSGFDAGTLFHKYALGYSPSQLWFLLMLFWVFLLFRLLPASFPAGSAGGVLLMAAVSIAGGWVFNKAGLGIYQLSTAVHYTVFFCLGGYLYHRHGSAEGNDRRAVQRPQALRTGCICAVLSVGGFLVRELLNASDGILIKLIRTGLGMLVSIAGVLMVYYLVMGLEGKLNALKKFPCWNTLSRDSFGIYLFHQQVIYLTILLLNGRVHPVVQVLLSFLLSIGISEGIVLLLRRWRPTRVLFGL